jgi:hypothetical protein
MFRTERYDSESWDLEEDFLLLDIGGMSYYFTFPLLITDNDDMKLLK